MISLSEEWRHQDAVRRAPDTAAEWDKRADTFTAKDAPSDYITSFLSKMELLPGETVLDMGCGAGSLAVPLAKAGHGVIAADFSRGMLDRLADSMERESVVRLGVDLREGQTSGICPVLMSWEDDWDSFGVGEGCVDVVIASRSIITHDLEDSIRKISCAARRRVCVTAGTGISPRVDPKIARVMGIQLARHNDALFVFGIASDLGYEPEVSYIHSPRTRVYSSPDEAYHSLLRTIEYVDDHAEQVPPALAAERLSVWLDEHLVPAEGGQWRLDEPTLVPWAFISWNV